MSRLTLSLGKAPRGARLHAGTLAEFEGARRASADERARSMGRAEGYQEAMHGAAAALTAAVEALDAQRAEMSESLAETAAQLATEMLQDLLRVELIAGNYDIVAIVRATIAEAGNSPGAMTLHVHPEDAAKLADVPFRTGTTIEADPAVRRGDVELHTRQGLLVRDLDACAASMRERIRAEASSC